MNVQQIWVGNEELNAECLAWSSADIERVIVLSDFVCIKLHKATRLVQWICKLGQLLVANAALEIDRDWRC